MDNAAHDIDLWNVELNAPTTLATDLDGTLIPLPNHQGNVSDLHELASQLRQKNRRLVFATGRHIDSIKQAISVFGLPLPHWIVSDVGANIYQVQEDGSFQVMEAYQAHLSTLTAQHDRNDVVTLLQNMPNLILQESENQKAFKISYYTKSFSHEILDATITEIERLLEASAFPYETISSIDHNAGGMIDLLPRRVSKSYALLWLATHADFCPGEMLYAGDSGNDFAALAGGYRAIVVANATPGLAEKVSEAHAASGKSGRLYLASNTATSAVLEGCRHYGLI